MPENIELTNSPQHTSVVADVEEARLLTLMDSVDSLHRELTRIRRQLRDMLPRPSYTLATPGAGASPLRRTSPARRWSASSVRFIAPTWQSSRPRSTACAPRATQTGS